MTDAKDTKDAAQAKAPAEKPARTRAETKAPAEKPTATDEEKREERLKRAEDSAKVEVRPAQRGITSDPYSNSYAVEDELRAQWPDISLGDDKE